MRISRTQISFLTILAAGATLFAGTLLLPSPTTFGSETDVLLGPPTSPQSAAPSAQPAAPVSPAPAAQPSASQAPAPPQAPLDGGVGGVNVAAILPSTGSSGYLAEDQQASAGYLLLALGVALVGAGSMVWVVSRRSR